MYELFENDNENENDNKILNPELIVISNRYSVISLFMNV
jgi:hypothetical protein